MELREKVLLAAARLACRRCYMVIGVALLLTALSIVVMTHQGYSSSFNVARMLPQNIPAARVFTSSLTDFGTVDESVVVFWLNPDDPRAVITAGKVSDRLVERLQAHRDINSAFSKMLTPAEKDQLLNVELPKHGMLLLRADDLDKIAERLRPAAMERAVANTVRKLSTIDADSEAGKLLLMDALGLGGIFQNRFADLLGGAKPAEKSEEKVPAPETSAMVIPGIDDAPAPVARPEAKSAVADAEKKHDNHGYMVSPNGRMLLVIAQPKYAAQNVPFARRIMEFMEHSMYEILVGVKPLAVEDSAAWDKVFAFLRDNPRYRELCLAVPENLWKKMAAPGATPEDVRAALEGVNQALRAGAGLDSGARAEIAGQAKEFASLHYDGELARQALALKAGRAELRRLCAEAGIAVAADNTPAVAPGALKSFYVEFAGGYQVSRCYASKVNSIMLGTLALSGILVLLFFGWCFRRLGVLIYIGIPLVMIISWTGCAGWLLFGQLNLISCAFAAVLVGLGVDYAVHIYNRYIEERSAGADTEAAFTAAVCHTGWGVIIGMLTTCFAFIALLASRFQHLAEFGALGAIGIFLSAPAMMLVMPALITARNRWQPESLRIFKPSEFMLPRLVGFLEKHRRPVVVASVVCAALSLCLVCFSGKLDFNSSMAALRPRDRAFEINGEITRAFSTRNPNKLNFIVHGDTEAAALEKLASFDNGMRELESKNLIKGFESITKFLPAPSEQRKLLEKMRQIDLPGAAARLRAILKRDGLDPEYFAFNLRLLEQHAKLVEAGKVVLPSDFHDSKISRLLKTMIARRQAELHLGDGVPENLAYPLTLAKPAVTAETARQIYPAGAKLSRADILGLIPTDPADMDRVTTLTYFDRGFAVKATVYPPVPAGSSDGEPHLTAAWMDQVCQILGLDPAQFAAAENPRDFDAALTGVPIASAILATIVKEDFLRISLCIALICLAIINLFFHPRPWRAALGTFPLFGVLLFAFFYRHMLHGAVLYTLYGVLAALFLWLALCHRYLGRVLACFVPVGLGLLYMFGIMAGMNCLGAVTGLGDILNLNFVNVLTIPIIIGVGVDNGIHMVHRYYESGRRLKPMVVDTGRALAITALTSIVGFGSLYLAKFQGLDSIAELGLLSTIALVMVLLSSLVAFPVLLAACAPLKNETPGNV